MEALTGKFYSCLGEAYFMERRTFLGTVSTLLSPLSVDSATATETTTFGCDPRRSDITVENAVFTGRFASGTATEFVETHQDALRANSGPHPGHHMDLPSSGTPDSQVPLITVYPSSDKFILRTQPDGLPFSRVDETFTGVLTDAGLDPQPVFDSTEVANIIARGELDIGSESLDLGSLALLLRRGDYGVEDVVYAPEKAPMLKVTQEPVTAMVFPEGEVVLPGATDSQEIVAAMDTLETAVDDLGSQSARLTST